MVTQLRLRPRLPRGHRPLAHFQVRLLLLRFPRLSVELIQSELFEKKPWRPPTCDASCWANDAIQVERVDASDAPLPIRGV